MIPIASESRASYTDVEKLNCEAEDTFGVLLYESGRLIWSSSVFTYLFGGLRGKNGFGSEQC